jgi:hypothetical protein
MTAFRFFIMCVCIGLASIGPASWAATADLLAGSGPEQPNIDACVSRLDPQLDIGYDRIAARCPELVKQLDQGAWSAWLPSGWKQPGNDLSAGGLKEFRELVNREVAARTSSRTPDVRSLRTILTTLNSKEAKGRWSRFKSWLRSILEAREQAPDESWFSRMVSHVGLSQSLRQVVVYAALGTVIVLAAVIIFNELRNAGLLSRRRAARDGRTSERLPATATTWSDVERSPLLDKPRRVLELVLGRLGERGYLPPAGALTVRELTQSAQLPEQEDRARLLELATAAERVRYSAGEVEAALLERSVVRGRELLDRLDASPAQ